MTRDEFTENYVLSEKTMDQIEMAAMVNTFIIYGGIIAAFIFFSLPTLPVLIAAFLFGLLWKWLYPHLTCIYLSIYNKGRYDREIKKHPECANLNFEAMNALYRRELDRYRYMPNSDRYERGPLIANYRFITLTKRDMENEAERRKEEKEQMAALLEKQRKEAEKAKEIEEARARVKENEIFTNKAAKQTISTYKATIELMTDKKLSKAKNLAERLVEACNDNSLALESCQRMFVAYIPEAIRILEEYRNDKVSKEMEETVDALVKKLEDTLQSSLKKMQKDSDKYFKDNVSMLMETLEEEQFKNKVE